MFNKFTQFADFIAHEAPDVIAINETCFDDNVLDPEFVPEGYSAFWEDIKIFFYAEGTYKQENRGGILIHIKSHLHTRLYTPGEIDA